jgi:hypothetical protein
MQRVNEFVFYDLAVKLHKFTELQDGLKFSAIWSDWWDAREALNEIFRLRPMNFTLSTATDLYALITEVVPAKWEEVLDKFPKADEEEKPIPPWTIRRIKTAAQEFETVIRNECVVMDAYYVTKKGAYSTADLVNNAHFQVPEPTRSRLPEQTRTDFDQAGKCLAFDVPTAAAFHVLRGTEAVVRKYYEQIVPGGKTANTKMRNWGAYIRLLNKHGAEAKITSLLEHIRDVYRNPVLHPEENYTDEQIQVLFGGCISAVVLIETEIGKLSAKSGTLQFPPTNPIALSS